MYVCISPYNYIPTTMECQLSRNTDTPYFMSMYVCMYVFNMVIVYSGVEMFKKTLDFGQAGDNVGILLRGWSLLSCRKITLTYIHTYTYTHTTLHCASLREERKTFAIFFFVFPLLTGLKRDDVKRGQVMAAPNTLKTYKKFQVRK